MSPVNDSIKLAKLPRLKEDGSNWSTYKHHISDHLGGKGIGRHLRGFATPPGEVVMYLNQFFLKSDTDHTTPLTQTQVNEYEEAFDKWAQDECLGFDVLNATLPASTELELREFPTLAQKWAHLHTIFEKRGEVMQNLLLSKLTTARYTGGSIRAHINYLRELRNELAENDFHVPDNMFRSFIFTSVLGDPHYDNLLSALRISAVTVTTEDVIRTLIEDEEAHAGTNPNGPGSHTTPPTTDPSSSALASHSQTTSSSNGPSEGYGRRMEYYCTICKKNGHSKERCFAPGGGLADKAPEWWKKQQAERQGENTDTRSVEHTAAAATKHDSDDLATDHFFAMTTFTPNLTSTPTSSIPSPTPAHHFPNAARPGAPTRSHNAPQFAVEGERPQTRDLVHITNGEPRGTPSTHHIDTHPSIIAGTHTHDVEPHRKADAHHHPSTHTPNDTDLAHHHTNEARDVDHIFAKYPGFPPLKIITQHNPGPPPTPSQTAPTNDRRGRLGRTGA